MSDSVVIAALVVDGEERGAVGNLDRLLAHPLGIVAGDANDFGTGRHGL